MKLFTTGYTMASKHPNLSRLISSNNGMDYFENTWKKWVEAKQWHLYPQAMVNLVESYEEEFKRVLKDVMVTNCVRCRGLFTDLTG